MTNLSRLEDKIKELVPEICCQKCQQGHLYLGIDDNGDPIWGGCDDCVIDGVYVPYQRPITLEDIIYVLSIKAQSYSGKEYPTKELWLGAIILNTISGWKLGKPLSEQSEEVINNLLKILEV